MVVVVLWFCRGECWNDVVWRETWSWLSYGSAGVNVGMTWCGGRHGRGCLMVLQG